MHQAQAVPIEATLSLGQHQFELELPAQHASRGTSVMAEMCKGRCH